MSEIRESSLFPPVKAEHRAELERLGWRSKRLCAADEVWENLAYPTQVHVYGSGRAHVQGSLDGAIAFAMLIVQAPPGYRIVPEAVAREAAWLLCKMAEGDAPTHFDRTRAPEVAAALRGECQDKRAIAAAALGLPGGWGTPS